jgi:hypothetical protein
MLVASQSASEKFSYRPGRMDLKVQNHAMQVKLQELKEASFLNATK